MVRDLFYWFIDIDIEFTNEAHISQSVTDPPLKAFSCLR